LKQVTIAATGNKIIGRTQDAPNKVASIFVPENAKKGRNINIVEVLSIGDGCNVNFVVGDYIFTYGWRDIPNTQLSFCYENEVIGKRGFIEIEGELIH